MNSELLSLQQEVDSWFDKVLLSSILDHGDFDNKYEETVSITQDFWTLTTDFGNIVPLQLVDADFQLVDPEFQLDDFDFQLDEELLQPTSTLCVDARIDWFGEPAKLVIEKKHHETVSAEPSNRRERRKRHKKRKSKAKAIVKKMKLFQQRYSTPIPIIDLT